MKKIYLILFLLLQLFSFNFCHAQQQKNFFPILRNTSWATDAVACDTLVLITGHEAMILNCSFAMDTIGGTYKFIADDTVVAEFTTSTGAKHFPKDAPPDAIPHFAPFRTTYHFSLKDNTLTTVFFEQKNSAGNWVKVTSTDATISNYNWYKGR